MVQDYSSNYVMPLDYANTITSIMSMCNVLNSVTSTVSWKPKRLRNGVMSILQVMYMVVGVMSVKPVHMETVQVNIQTYHSKGSKFNERRV